METSKDVIKLTESMVVSKANDSIQVSAGLAALSNKNMSNGILMKGNLITRPLKNKDVVKNLLSTNRQTVLKGFNALLDVNDKKDQLRNENIYIGKVECLKTLRKGGYF